MKARHTSSPILLAVPRGWSSLDSEPCAHCIGRNEHHTSDFTPEREIEMKNVIGMVVVAVALVLGASAEPAQAQVDGFGYGGYGALGYGGIGGFGLLGLNGSAYRTGRIPTPPYFALNPPVYYSRPVARPYGHSPFAYPGTHETPAPAMAKKAAMITNPHVRPVKKSSDDALDLKKMDLKKADMKEVTQTQFEIINPFFQPKMTLVSVLKK